MTETATTQFKAVASGAGFRIGAAVTAIFLVAALTSSFWTPYPVDGLNIAERFSPPSPENWFGANHLGRDLLSMIMVGARISIGVAATAIFIGMVIGVPLGLFAAAYGGIVDGLIMRAGDVIFAFPAILLAILIAAVYGPSAMNAVIAIGVFNIPVFARVTRGAALSLWQRDFILAAQMAGRNRLQISVEHILPNVSHLLIVQGTVQFSLAILAEAGLSYVGLGVQPPTPSWGRMLAESQTMISFAPWLVIFPGLAIFLFVMALNLVGDGLNKRLDPRERRLR